MSASTVLANEIRSTGPKHNQWPADLPQVRYILADGETLCITCANGGNGSCAGTADEAPEQWRIVGAQTADEPTPCAHCERIIRP